MRAPVTGANGFLGAWLTRKIVRFAAHVRCFVRKTSATAELEGLPVELMYGDVVDERSLRWAVEGCEVVTSPESAARRAGGCFFASTPRERETLARR